jgi:two-component system cell cycle sensor histidine kinase/response regulator CckA
LSNNPKRLGPSSAIRWRIRSYFAVLLAAFVVVAIAGFAYVEVQTGRDARRSAEHDSRFTAETAAGQLGQELELLRANVSALAANPGIPDVFAHPATCSLTFGWLTPGHLDIVGSDGASVCSSNPALLSAHHAYAGASWLGSGIVSITTIGPTHDPATGQDVVMVVAPVTGKGVVAAFANVGPLGAKLVSLYGGGKPIALTIANRATNTVVVSSIDPPRFVGASLKGTPFATGATRHADLVGTMRVFASAAVPGSTWVVYAGEDEAAAEAAGIRLEHREFAIIGGGIALWLLAAIFVYGRIARPISKLATEVRAQSARTSRGSITVSGPAEVEDLASDVNSLLASLSVSEASYRGLFDHHPEPMWVFDRETLRFLDVNEASIAMYGYSREEFLDMTIEDIRPPEELEELRGVLAERSRDSSESRVWRHRKKDGTLLDAAVTAHSVDFEGHEARLVLSQDVTERRKIEERLRQSEKMDAIGRLAGGIAHDFNNLLLVIRGYSSILLESDGDDGTRASLLQIDGAAKKAAEFTHQLLAFSRQQVLRPEHIDANGVVSETAQLVRRMLAEDIELDLELEPQLAAIIADPGQLGQVVLNLLVNAGEALPQGGRIAIKTANVELDDAYALEHPGVRPGRYALIQVTDTGAGMDGETQSRIFDPFFSTKETGTGLGLATVHGIVEQSGGHLWVYSAPGLGTTFKVYLPIATEPAADTPTLAETVSLAGDETILLVEDADVVRQLVSQVLASYGYNVVSAASGLHALRIADEYSGAIDLLLTDIVMPSMNGRELAEKLVSEMPHLKVLFTSGYPADAVVRTGIEEARSAFIEKPYVPAELARTIRTLLDSDV